ncbi:hypothetical protein ACJZ2D_017079 [Fusarium nematophilum]
MSRLRLPLDFDASVTGVYMENLIDLWCSKGLTTDQADDLLRIILPSYRLYDGFVKCLGKPLEDFKLVRDRLMETLEDWEEIPAWDEVYRLKLAFTSSPSSALQFSSILMRYTVIVCVLLPRLVLGREKHAENWKFIPESLCFGRPKGLMRNYDTPPWYTEEFNKYLERQAERDRRRCIGQETWLKLNALTSGYLSERHHVHVDMAAPYMEIEQLLEKPDLIPLEWFPAISKKTSTPQLVPPDYRMPARGEPWLPPDFTMPARAKQQSLPAPLPPDFTEQDTGRFERAPKKEEPATTRPSFLFGRAPTKDEPATTTRLF